MRVLTFNGGIHPPHHKSATENKSVEVAVQPKSVYIPLSQHIGAPCTALVKVGDVVKKGQKIGEPGGFVSAPVHSSVSGIVKSIKAMTVPGGQKAMCVEIENDFKEEVFEEIKPYLNKVVKVHGIIILN